MKTKLNIALEGTCSGDVVGGLLSWTGEPFRRFCFCRKGVEYRQGDSKERAVQYGVTAPDSPKHDITKEANVMAENTVSLKDTLKQEGSIDGFEAHLGKMSKMKYVDFRKEAIQIFKEIQDTMLDNVKWNAEQRKLVLNASKDAFKVNDRLLNLIMDRIENLEHQVYAVAVIVKKSGRTPTSLEDLKQFASGLNIDFDSLRAECEEKATESPAA